MATEKNHHARFLSVAYAQGRLTRRQIGEIAAEQGRLRQAGIHEKVGPIAATLGYLSPQEAAKIEEERLAIASRGEELPDVLRQARARVRRPSPQVRRILLFGSALFAIGVLIAVWVATRSWTDVASAASIVALLAVVIPELLLGPRLTPSGWLRWISGPIALLITVVLYKSITVSLPGWWYVGLMILPLLVGLEAGAGFWRNFKLETSDLRSCLMRCLAKNFRDNFMAVQNGEKQLSSAINELLDWTARIIYLNPWNRLFRFIVPEWYAHPGVTSLWFFRPELLGSDVVFRASESRVIGPQQIAEAFSRFQEKYRPRINVEKLAAEQASIKKGGFNPEVQFLKEPYLRLKRAEYVSLPGLAFVVERGIDGKNIMNFWGFDEAHYREIIDAETGDNKPVQRGARWRAFSAYPVYAGGPQRGQPPIGVLVAFSNAPNGFTMRDRNAFVSAARLLGVLLDNEHAAAFTSMDSSIQPIEPESTTTH